MTDCTRTLCLWKPGTPIAGMSCHFAWTGSMPGTGREACMTCGRDKYTQVNVYEGTKLASIIEAEDPGAAWKAARSHVRYWAHRDPVAGQAPRWEQPRGRFSYTVGKYSAVSAIRSDR